MAATGVPSVIDQAIDILNRRGRVSLAGLALDLHLTAEQSHALRTELVDVLGVASEPEPGILQVPGGRPQPGAASRAGAERRQVTFLMCDVVSSTELASRLDPEDLRDLMLIHQEACKAIIGRYGGHISQWIGDGVVVYFGFPEAHDDDAVRAVRAGLDIVAGTADYPPAHDGTRLQVRVGVHTGPSVVGDLGEGDGSETLAFGHTPNVCARIEAAADPGTVFVSEATATLVEGWVDLEDRGRHDLKGVAEPLRLLRVVGVRAARDRFEVMQTLRGIGPIVGRESEQARIADAWRRAATGEPQALLLIGEPGIGKSRLVHAARSLDSGSATLEFHSSPYDQASALQPMTVGLATMWGFADEPSPVRRLERVSAAVAACPELDPAFIVPWLAEMLGVPDAPAAPDDVAMTPQRRRAMTLQAVVSVVLSIADSSPPLLLVVEDAHWSDASTAELMQLLLTRSAGHPLLTLVTGRPEYRTAPFTLVGWQCDAVVPDTVTLEPLAPGDAAQLARLLVGEADERLVRRVVDSADGIPLFVEELTFALGETPNASDLELGGADEGAAIPPTLQSCLQARLDRLNPESRRVAQIAAAVGRSFQLPLLEAVRHELGLEGPMTDELAELQAAMLVRPDPSRADTCEFRHALVQEAAASSVLRADSRRHHGAIANVLLASGEARPDLVARHLSESGDRRRSIEYFQLAGLETLHRSAMQESIVHFESALRRLDAVPEGPERDGVELPLRVLSAVPLTVTRGFADPSVRDAYERAADLCAALGPRPELFPTLSGLFTFDIVRGELEAARNRGVENLAVAEASGRPDLLAVAEQDLGAVLVYLGACETSIAHVDRAVSYADSAAHHEEFVTNYARDPVAVAIMHRAMARVAIGQVDGALSDAWKCVEQTDQWPHPFTRLWALTAAAVIHVLRGEAETAGQIVSATAAESAELGFPNWESQSLVYKGWSMARAGAVAEGRETLRRGRAGWAMTGSVLMEPLFVLLEADVARMAGEGDPAEVLLDRGWADAQRRGEVWSTAELRRLGGDIALARGDTSLALSRYDEALGLAERFGLHWFALRAALARVEVVPGNERPAAVAVVAEHLARIEGGEGLAEVVAARELLKG